MNTLQVPELGTLGGFGNRIHIYCVARKYSEMNDAVLLEPPWMGQSVFDFIIRPLVRWCPTCLPQTNQKLKWPLPDSFTGDAILTDFAWFNYPAIYSQADLRRYLTIKPEHLAAVTPPEIAVHYRKFVTADFPHVPDLNRPQADLECIKRGVKSCGLDWSKVEIIGEQDPGLDSNFDRNRDTSFISDFVKLATAKHLFVYPYSTFSSYASWFNPNKLYEPYEFIMGKSVCSWKLYDGRNDPNKNQWK